MSSKSKKLVDGQPQEMQEQLSNTIRLPNSRVYLRSEENHWKVLRSCDLLKEPNPTPTPTPTPPANKAVSVGEA